MVCRMPTVKSITEALSVVGVVVPLFEQENQEKMSVTALLEAARRECKGPGNPCRLQWERGAG